MEARSFTIDPVSGDLLFTRSDGIHQYDWASTPQLWLSWAELNLHEAPEWAGIALSPCATRLVVHQQLFDVSTRQLITTTPRGFLRDANYAIDDEEWEIIPTRNGAIFTAADTGDTFVVFDARSGKTGQPREGSGLEYSPTSNLLAYRVSYPDDLIIVERLEDGQRVFKNKVGYGAYFTWAPEGHALLKHIMFDVYPSLLDIGTGGTCPALPQMETLKSNLHSDPYRQRVLRTQGSTLEMWETSPPGRLLARNTDGLPARDVRVVQFLLDGLLASFGQCGAQTHLWEVVTGNHLASLDTPDLDHYATTPLVMSTDQQTLALCNRNLKLWQCPPPHGLPSPTPRIVPAPSDEDSLVACFPCPDAPTDFLAVLCNQSSSSTLTFTLRTVLDPRILSTLLDADLFISGDYFYLRGSVLYGIGSVYRKKGTSLDDNHKVVFAWNWRTGERLSNFPPGSCATISPDGRWLAFARDEEGPTIAYEVWDIWKQERVMSIPTEQLTDHGGRCWFGPDSRTLLIGLYVFDALTGEQRMRLPDLACEPRSASFSPNGQYLALSSGTRVGRGAVTVFGSPERAWFAPFLDHQRKVGVAVAAGTLTEVQGQQALAELSQPHLSVLLEAWLANQISDAFFAGHYPPSSK